MFTVNELLEECEKQKAKGNGNKKVYISCDDEGNGFHALFYSFTDNKEDIQNYNDLLELPEDDLDNIVLLG